MATLEVSCPACGKKLTHEHWFGANFCRAAALVGYIADHPNISAWELSQATGVPYTIVGKGLQKAREYELLVYDLEEREAGGIRYRYRVAHGWERGIQDWRERGKI